MGVDTTDRQLLEKCFEDLTASSVIEYIGQHRPADCMTLACAFDSLASIAPELVQSILDKMDYVFYEGRLNLPGSKRVLGGFKELSQIKKPVVAIFLGLGPIRFKDTPLYKKLHNALGPELVKDLDPINALCSELVIKRCPEITRPFYRDKRLPKISFIILSGLNNAKVLDEMLRSFSSKTPPRSDIEVITVINGSNDGSAEIPHRHLKNRYNYRIVYLPENLGIAGGYNEGIALARGRYICLLQDDVIFEKQDWHRELAYYLDIYPKIGVMGGQQARFYFRLPEVRHAFEPPYVSVGSDRWLPLRRSLVKVDAALCMAVMFRRELGFYDERFLPNGLEDIAFCFRARKEGWTVYATDVGVKHELGGRRSTTHRRSSNFTDKLNWLLKKLFGIDSGSNSDFKKSVANRLSRAYHYRIFMQEYGDMLTELPSGRSDISLNEIEKNIELLPKEWQDRRAQD